MSTHSQSARVAAPFTSTSVRPRWAAAIAAVGTILLAVGFTSTGYAQLGARPTEQWLKTLDSANRLSKLKVEDVVTALKLKPGAVIADIGAGSGAFTLPLAKAVPNGKVYAVDIDQGLVDHITQRAKEGKAENVHAILGSFTDPKLPRRDVDVAFIFDVLHHIENRTEYLKNLVTYLKPTGRVAIVDFHPELGPHKDDPKLQVKRDEAKAWLAALGFKQTEEHALYTDKWYVVYSR